MGYLTAKFEKPSRNHSISQSLNQNMPQKPPTLYRTIIEISTRAIRHNYRIFRKLIGNKVQLLGVVKSNAYGHGLLDFSQTLAGLGIDWLGVDSITEANSLRNKGITAPILVLGYTLPANFALAAHHNLAITISSFENLKILAKTKKQISLHLKMDTGMHRQGFFINDLLKIFTLLTQTPHLHFAGIYTHFASAKNPYQQTETQAQINLFQKALALAKKFNPKILAHSSSTGGVLNFPKANFDMVRVGIGMYGLWPSTETKKTFGKSIKLEPVLTWKTIISELKTVEKGAKVGYDYTETLKRQTKLAVLPVGYWHGFSRSLSRVAQVLINGQRARVIGTVSMDMIVVDVTDIKGVKVGDTAVLIGKQVKDEISADELANLAGTSNYEIVTRLNPLIKKYYL